MNDRDPLVNDVEHQTAAATGRSIRRYRQVRLSAIASAAAKAISIFTALISVPLTLKYLGAERYGMWLTLSGFTSMLSFADLGIGAGVTGAVATADGSGDAKKIRSVVANGYATLTVVALAIAVAVILLYPFVEWPTVFNVTSPEAKSESGPALVAFILCFAAAFPMGVIERLQMGVQKSFLASLWKCFGSIASLLTVLGAVYAHAGLVWLILSFSGVPVISSLLNAAVFFIRHPQFRPSIRDLNATDARIVMRVGLIYFTIQIFSSVAKYSDNIVIAQIMGSAAVPVFAVPEKLFAQISGLAGMVIWPLWPAYREAIVQQDFGWIRNTLRKSVFLTIFGSGFAATILVLAGPLVISFWTGGVIHPTFLLLLGLGVWKMLESTSFAIETFLNGIGALRELAFGWIATALVSIGLEILVVPKAGVVGVVWATILAFCLCAITPWCYIAYRRLSLLRL